MEAEKYSKILVAGDITGRLIVPGKWMEIMEHLFANNQTEASLRILDWLGNGHDLRMAIRKRGNRKPVVQAHEWKAFVAYVGLQAGDKISIFPLDGPHFRGATHGIVAKRLGSDGLWADLATPQHATPELLSLLSRE